VFAGTVADAWKAFEAAAGYDPADPYSRAMTLGAPALPPVLRIAVPDRASRIFGSGAAEAAFDAAIGLLDGLGLGADPRAADLSLFFETARLLYEGAWVAERYAAIRDFIETRPEALFPVTRTIIEGARKLSAVDAFAGGYRLAELARATAPFWRDFDVLVVPSIPDICTLADVEREPVAANSRLGTYTNFVNLLDLAAVAVPGPFRPDGRPAGITLIAPAGRDALLAALAEKLHAAAGVPIGATGRPLPAPSIRPARAPEGMTEVAVLGAHLSGMALNNELVSRGGVFLRAVETARTYRLFALPGGPPHRPGLVRVAEGGASIATEVWALSPAAFGELVAAIPPPLGIGTLQLADGTAVKGFLCEEIAVAGARDISAFGGWRAYIAPLA
jgi:allophanate hydrolase